ncbi:DNA-directed DNA polymerase [Melia azedarach]|uniref:DNA-directed DNA polymerase n=1 Tax=Melia azedarach TaxID=155640 RepID=A0ACC1X5H8_MELAZ|nr:DNA-directed DNA polymerase [Melia azedarach]
MKSARESNVRKVAKETGLKCKAEGTKLQGNQSWRGWHSRTLAGRANHILAARMVQPSHPYYPWSPSADFGPSSTPESVWTNFGHDIITQWPYLVASGNLLSKTAEEAYHLLEEMACNNYQWPSERSIRRRAAEVHEMDQMVALSAHVAALSNQTKNFTTRETSTSQDKELANSIKGQLSGKFPSDTKPNPKDQCNAITLRSGKELEPPKPKENEARADKMKKSEVNGKEVEDEAQKEVSKPHEISFSNNPPLIVPPFPFPQRFQKKKLDAQFSKFLEMFKKLHINILFVDAWEQMPDYAKFMKEVMSKKRCLEEYETVKLTEECSSILQKKEKDPGSFTIACVGIQALRRYYVTWEQV